MSALLKRQRTKASPTGKLDRDEREAHNKRRGYFHLEPSLAGGEAVPVLLLLQCG